MIGSILIVSCLLATINCAANSTETQCYCGYRRSGQLLTLRCASNKDDLPLPTFHPVLCQRVGDNVRIGDSTSLTITQGASEFVGMTIEPYGLSQLQEGGRVAKLQINLSLQAKLLDSFAFAGLPDLTTLQAWRKPIALESCSLAGLPRLENLVISCSSTFDRFLSFGPAFKNIRLTGCLGRPLQFICSQCGQRPEISVLRILPGPPSTGGILTFENWSNSTETTSSVTLGTCRPGVCSDDHLCRQNYPLKMVRGHTPIGLPHETPEAILKPTAIAHPQLKSGQRFLTIFLPIFLVILAISIAVCMFISLRISKAFGKKRQVLNHTHKDVHASQNLNWSTFVPLNEFNAKV